MQSQHQASDVLVLDALRRSPQVQSALTERQKQVVAERKQLLARLAEAEDGVPARRYLAAVKLTERLADEVDKAREAFAAAQLRFDDAYRERISASQTIARERDEAIRLLHAGADSAAIDAFTRWARAEMTQTRKALEAREIVSENKITGKKSFRTESNSELIAARVLSINSAISEAEDLRLLPDQSNVATKLQAIRDAIPAQIAPLASSGRDV